MVYSLYVHNAEDLLKTKQRIQPSGPEQLPLQKQILIEFCGMVNDESVATERTSLWLANNSKLEFTRFFGTKKLASWFDYHFPSKTLRHSFYPTNCPSLGGAEHDPENTATKVVKYLLGSGAMGLSTLESHPRGPVGYNGPTMGLPKRLGATSAPARRSMWLVM